MQTPFSGARPLVGKRDKDCQRTVVEVCFAEVSAKENQACMSDTTQNGRKKRLTLRTAHCGRFQEDALQDGRTVLKPHEPVNLFTVSRRTLRMMDSSMASFKKGLVSAPVDLSAFTPRKKK